MRAIPQLGGVVIEDDVVDRPALDARRGNARVRRGSGGARSSTRTCTSATTRDIGEGTIIAAQCGFAGSVTIGRGVLVGGQVGIADHVIVGDGARIAAKSGVIGDVPAGADRGRISGRAARALAARARPPLRRRTQPGRRP